MIRFLRSILGNIATLILSFVLAVIIWYNALQGEDPLRTQFLQVPIDLVGRPANSILVTPNTNQSVQIIFQGPSSIVTTLTDQNFSAVLDLSQVPYGEEVPVPVLVQSSDPEVTILSQSPEQLSIYLEQTVSREIPVELDLRGSVAIGYSQGQPLVDPENILVSGIASQVEALDVARVTVFLNNERETVQRTPQPIYYNRQGRPTSISGLDVSTEQVEITIPINESAGFAEKTINVDLQGEPAPGYRVVGVEVEPPTVLLQGRPTQLIALQWVNTEEIDVNGLTESFRPQVALSLPEGVTLAEVEEIFVNVTIEPFRTTSIFNRIPQIQGLDEELTAELETESIRIVLFGPLPALNALADEDVTAVLDLFGLEPGTYSLEPDINFPEQRGIELRSIQPAQVTVFITETVTTTLGLTGTAALTNTNTMLPHKPPVSARAAHHTPGGVREQRANFVADRPKSRYYSQFAIAVY